MYLFKNKRACLLSNNTSSQKGILSSGFLADVRGVFLWGVVGVWVLFMSSLYGIGSEVGWGSDDQEHAPSASTSEHTSSKLVLKNYSLQVNPSSTEPSSVQQVRRPTRNVSQASTASSNKEIDSHIDFLIENLGLEFAEKSTRNASSRSNKKKLQIHNFNVQFH